MGTEEIAKSDKGSDHFNVGWRLSISDGLKFVSTWLNTIWGEHES
jgi:hypothetical protein